jgi:hypothetical protein
MISFRSVALSGFLLTAGLAEGSRPSTFRTLQEEGSTVEESGGGPTFSHGKDCVPCADDTNECVIKVKVNMHAGETGTSLRTLSSILFFVVLTRASCCSISLFVKGTMSLKAVRV